MFVVSFVYFMYFFSILFFIFIFIELFFCLKLTEHLYIQFKISHLMYEQILADIENFKIRGDETITKWGVLAFSLKIKELGEKCSFISTYLKSLDNFKKEILSLRPNEISLTNSLTYIFKKQRYAKFQSLAEICDDVNNRLSAMEGRLNYDLIKISSVGSQKIKKGMSVYTHGHSSLVLGILEDAQKYNKFDLKITDSILPVRDYFLALSKFMSLTYFPFHMVESAVLSSDIILLGVTAIKNNNFICQSGAGAVAILGKIHNVPVYAVSNLLKYSPDSSVDLECLDPECVLMSVPKSVSVVANEFDVVDGNMFKGIISEEGILSVVDFIDLAKREHSKDC